LLTHSLQQEGRYIMNQAHPKTIDDYIAGFPDEVKTVLKQIRSLIREAAPEASETIKYAIPAFVLNGKNLVHFAAFKNHIGFYPIPTGIEAFKNELSIYKQGKGSVQFPLNKPIPLDLISRIVQFRVKENNSKTAGKKTLRTCKNGHTYYKSSDCPVCPICEQERKPQSCFLTLLSAPARRALENNGITFLEKLAEFSEKEILTFHGIGKTSIPKLREALTREGLKFKADN